MTLADDRLRERGSSAGTVLLGIAVATGLLASAGCDGSIGEREPAARSTDPVYEPQPGPLRRLAAHEYRNTVQDLFGPDIVPPAVLETDHRHGGEYGLIAVGVSTFALSSRGVEAYEDAAYALAEQAFAADDPSTFVGCDPGGVVDAACADQFLTRFGRKAWRRPLSSSERARLVTVAGTAADRLGDFHEGLAFAVAAILQSPYFIFRAEVGRPSEEHPGWHELTDWELAARLSYLIWASTPDDALLDAAAAGELATAEGVEAQARRMLADPKAREGLRAFVDDMLMLDELDELGKDPTLFLHFNAEVGPSAREETLLGFEHLVFEEDGDFRDIFTTRETFIDRTLAAIYAVPAPAREGFGLYEHSEESGRRGLLGQVGFLAANAHYSSSSATLRGAYIRRVLMCQPVPAPPPDVDTALEPSSPDAPTLRQRVARHLEEPRCAGCHKLMDPLGLGLENFDALGRYRTTENDIPIDASGYLNESVRFDDAAGLAQALADSPATASCLVRTLYRYGTGHLEIPSESSALRRLEGHFVDSGYRVKALILALATSDAFRLVAPPDLSTPAESGSEVSE